MGGKWHVAPLESCLDSLIDYRGISPPKSSAGIPVISAKVIKNGRIEKPVEQCISEEDYVWWMRRGTPAQGDVILTTEGPLGETAILDQGRYAPGQRVVFLRGKPAELYSRYLFYYLRSPDGQAELRKRATGTTVEGISQAALRDVPVILPPMQEQRAIGNLLGSLDDKIELNRRMAETLEAMARALFKSWFVDFNPVHAKGEGRPTGLPEELSALFPDVFDEMLPQGWKNQPLSKLGQFLNGLALQKYPPSQGQPSLPVIKIPELRSGPTNKSNRANEDLPPEYVVGDGDHLFSWSGSLMHCRWSYGPGALNQHVFKVIANSVPDWLLYEGVEIHLPEFQRIAAGKAVTMGHIQRQHLDQALIPVPPKPLLKAIDAIMSPFYRGTLFLALQSRTLVALRDTLLPKLISGELRISDAEKQIAAA